MAELSTAKLAEVAKKGHPKGLYYLFGTEAMERFSYYGMRAILVLYLVAETSRGGMEMSRSEALSVYATYTGLVYLTPLIGGFLADKYLGAIKAIFIGGAIMMFGEMAMMFPETLNLGLALLILGNGFFKPNISTIVGSLYEDGDPRRDSAFTIFYMGINLGAFFSPFVCGTLGELYGFKYGFMAAAIGMGLGVVIFAFGLKLFKTAGLPPGRVANGGEAKLNRRDLFDMIGLTALVAAFAYGAVTALPSLVEFWALIPREVKLGMGILLLLAAFTGLFGMAYKGGHADGGREKAISDVKAVGAILILSIFVIFFWLGFEQAGGTMNLFAAEQTDRNVLGFEIPASYFQAVNPIFIVTLAPLFAMMWTKLDSSKYRMSVVYKMVIGLVLLGLGFVLLYAGQSQVQTNDIGEYIVKASPLFLVGVYLIHTMGELCLSPIGLSLVTKLSPVRMVSLMMGVWFLSSATANYFAGNLEKLIEAYDVPIFAFLIASSFAAAFLLLIISPFLRKWMKNN